MQIQNQKKKNVFPPWNSNSIPSKTIKINKMKIQKNNKKKSWKFCFNNKEASISQTDSDTCSVFLWRSKVFINFTLEYKWRLIGRKHTATEENTIVIIYVYLRLIKIYCLMFYLFSARVFLTFYFVCQLKFFWQKILEFGVSEIGKNWLKIEKLPQN